MEQKQLSLENMSKEIIALKKKMEQMEESIAEDLKFAIRTELAWQSHDRGEFTSYSKDEFLKKLEKW
ncbi:MAG: hypothetical protein Q8O84_04985 [Nanoarchaeota archaeon]|nr:hypothetical protein [Nanoarchaeota archaeon]